MLKKAYLLISLTFILAMLCAIQVFAAQSTPPLENDITITNNIAGMPDAIDVGSLTAGDIVKVYTYNLSTTPIGISVANGTTATVYIEQLGASAGNVYISITSAGNSESTRTAKSYIAEDMTTAPSDTDITVQNNLTGTVDVITISNLVSGDIVRAYSSLQSNVPISSIICSDTVATLYFDQLGTTAGNIYISVKSTNKNESNKTVKAYNAEAITGLSIAPTDPNIVVSNNITGTDDTVVVSGLLEGDIVNVYASAADVNTIGTSTVATGQTSATISIKQIGTVAGNIFVSVKSTGKAESLRTTKAFTGEPISNPPIVGNVSITNNLLSIAEDTIDITGLTEGDIVKVYETNTALNPIANGVVAVGDTTIHFSIKQLGNKAGSIYITITNNGKLESNRLAVPYLGEPTTTVSSGVSIAITNNIFGVDDTIYITGLQDEDVVKVYKSPIGKEVIGTATVAIGQTTIAINISQLGAVEGKVYISITSKNKQESKRIMAAYQVEPTTIAPLKETIIITNNLGADDTIVVTGLSEGDVINVYSSLSAKVAMATGTVASAQTTATVKISQLGTTAGKLYISVKNLNKLESKRTMVTYLSEATSTAPLITNIVVNNYLEGTEDTIVVSGLLEGDVVNVYSSSTSKEVIGSATVATGQTSVIIKVPQLGAKAGKVFVSVRSLGKQESTKTAISYSTEISDTPLTNNILVLNNAAGNDDIIIITGLAAGDEVKIYDSAKGTTVIASGTVVDGATNISINVTQLGTTSGSIYISVTKAGKSESKRIAKSYLAE